MALRTALSRLSRGMVTFLAIDAVLVAVFVVLLVVTLTGSPGDGADRDAAAPSPSGQTSAPAVAPSGDAALAEFALPSGNIACSMSEEGARCEIASITFEPPADAACTGTLGHVVTVGAAGSVEVPCIEGDQPSVAGPDVPLLDYGFSSSVGGYTCTSTTSGVRCLEDATGRGFQLARGAYTELP